MMLAAFRLLEESKATNRKRAAAVWAQISLEHTRLKITRAAELWSPGNHTGTPRPGQEHPELLRNQNHGQEEKLL